MQGPVHTKRKLERSAKDLRTTKKSQRISDEHQRKFVPFPSLLLSLRVNGPYETPGGDVATRRLLVHVLGPYNFESSVKIMLDSRGDRNTTNFHTLRLRTLYQLISSPFLHCSCYLYSQQEPRLLLSTMSWFSYQKGVWMLTV